MLAVLTHLMPRLSNVVLWAKGYSIGRFIEVSRLITGCISRRFEAEQEMAAQRTQSIPIEPTITSTGQVLVTWYTTDDQLNPQNWSRGKKSYVSALIW